MSINSVLYNMSYYSQKAGFALRNPSDFRSNFKHVINNLPYLCGSDKALKPYGIEMIVNSTCNSRCLMCDIGLKNRQSQFFRVFNRNADMDIKKFERFIDEVKNFKPRGFSYRHVH